MAKRLEMWPLERLRPYANNARIHSERQVEQIAASIREFGFTAPILVDSADGILAGHGRLQAAQLLGLAEVPVVVLDHLDEKQRRAYLLADNRLAEGATWDEELLAKELAAIDLDPRVLGFDEDDLKRLHDGLEVLQRPGPGMLQLHGVAVSQPRLLWGDAVVLAWIDASPGQNIVSAVKATPGTMVLMPWQDAPTSRRPFVPGFDD
jgi:ParB-like chromosome segregation protein Spo0J